MSSSIKVPSPASVYRNTIPELPAPTVPPPKLSSSANSPLSNFPSSLSPHIIPQTASEPYLDIMVPADASVSRPFPHGASSGLPPGVGSSSAAAFARKFDDTVYVPALHHTGVRTGFSGAGARVGRNVKKAVRESFPAGDQRAVHSLKNTDVSRTVRGGATKGAGASGKRKGGGTKGRNVVLVSSFQGGVGVAGSNGSSVGTPPVGETSSFTYEDPFIDANGRQTTTKVHELIYSNRMKLPHAMRKTRYTQEILRQIKNDVQEFKSRIPI